MNVAQRVEAILNLSRMARNSDTELLIIYMQKSGMSLTKEQVALFRKLPAFETITRVRRKLQEEGKYVADKEVENARYNKFVNVKDNIASTPSNRIVDIFDH